MIAIKSKELIQHCCSLVFVFLLILLLASLGTGEVCGSIQSEESPIAHQPLALARYRILIQIERQTGESPFPGKSFSARDDVLFPLGRSDKTYILNRGYKFTKDGYPFVKLACYKSIGEGVRLLYSVKLKNVNKPAKDKIRVKNMAGYLSLLGESKGDPPFGPYSYAIPTNISKYAKRDLLLSQELVDYSNDSNIGILHIQCFGSKVATSIDEHQQSFFVPGNTPSAEQSEWYMKYGLPVADCELTVKSDEKK